MFRQRQLAVVFSCSALVCAFAATPRTARAQNYTASTTSGTFSSIASTGTSISVTSLDDGYGSFTAPFSFSWFGNTVFLGDTLYVNTNGMLVVGNASNERMNTSIPTAGVPDNFVAPFWDDLYVIVGGIYYSWSGSSGSYVLTVEWSDVSHYDFQNDTMSFQVKIYQATSVVELWYGARSGGSGWAGSIGIEDDLGGNGLQQSCTPNCTLADVPSGTVLRYTPTATPPLGADLSVSYVDAPPTTLIAGSSYTWNWEVENAGPGASPQSAIGLYAGFLPTVTTNDLQLDYQIVGALPDLSSTNGHFTVTVPDLSGSFYLAAIVDPLNAVSETSETNNRFAMGQVSIEGGGGTITVVTETLPEATEGQIYGAELAQLGADSPIWSIDSGGLPPGVLLNSSAGTLTGTPVEAGIFTFTVLCSEEGKTPGSAMLAIVVNQPPLDPVITTPSLPQGVVGVGYHAVLGAAGGTPPYTFAFNEAGPDWLSLETSTGRLSGTPTAPGTHTMNFVVRDSALRSGNATFTLVVVEQSALALAGSLTNAVLNVPYHAALVNGGVPPYTVQVSGVLPAGLSVNSAEATISGTATGTGNFTFTVDITDSDTPQGHVMGSLSLQVVMPTGLQIKVGEEVLVYTNTDAHVLLNAEGGVPPYTWSLGQGSVLPTGLVLNPMGSIDGRVMLASTATVTLRVEDTLGSSDSAVVHVKTEPYRPGTRDGTNGRDRGCGCETSAGEVNAGGTGLVLMLFGVALLFRRRA